MKTQFFFLSILFSVLLFSSCQKEFSLETTANRSSGSLQSNVTGECLPKSVNGIYEAGTVLNATTHYIDVQINVAKAGNYLVKSDTINGIFFQANGSFAATGLDTVRLTGNGTPLSAGINNFTIKYDSTICKVPVSILPSGSAGPATFTLSGGPNTCMDYILSGTYIKDVQLTAANTVVIKVNVTAIGTYSITTDVSNGITFSGTGSLTVLGNQTIILTAAGKPAAAGSTNIAVTSGTSPVASTCGFAVDVAGPADFTIDCASAVVDGIYETGQALDATNTVDIDVNVTTPGGYALATTAINGMTFSATGNFAATGIQTITLTGSGNPITEETSAIDITGGGTSCSFDVIVDAGAPVTDLKWQFTEGGVTYEGETLGAITLPAAGIESTGIGGETANGDISFALTLTKSGTMQTGTFSTNTALPGNMATLLVSNNTTALPLYSGILGSGTLTVNLTTYNETTKIAEGTFSGTVRNGANAIVTITNGSFKAEIL